MIDKKTGLDFVSQTAQRGLWQIECRRTDDYTVKKVVQYGKDFITAIEGVGASTEMVKKSLKAPFPIRRRGNKPFCIMHDFSLKIMPAGLPVISICLF